MLNLANKDIILATEGWGVGGREWGREMAPAWRRSKLILASADGLRCRRLLLTDPFF